MGTRLSMATEAPGQTPPLGKFSFDPSSGALSRHGETVFLRPKAQALLSHLLQNTGRVVSKSELLDAVWPEVTVTEDSLTQCVRELRKALGDEAQTLVRTVSRRGYMLAVASGPDIATDAPVVAVLRFGHGELNMVDPHQCHLSRQLFVLRATEPVTRYLLLTPCVNSRQAGRDGSAQAARSVRRIVPWWEIVGSFCDGGFFIGGDDANLGAGFSD